MPIKIIFYIKKKEFLSFDKTPSKLLPDYYMACVQITTFIYLFIYFFDRFPDDENSLNSWRVSSKHGKPLMGSMSWDCSSAGTQRRSSGPDVPGAPYPSAVRTRCIPCASTKWCLLWHSKQKFYTEISVVEIVLRVKVQSRLRNRNSCRSLHFSFRPGMIFIRDFVV